MSNQNQQVYISYAWSEESNRIADELDADLQASGIEIIRDKRALGYKGMIGDFMQQIGRGHAIVVIVSDKYLKSPNCMYELVEISKNKDIYDRIFPVVLGDADIYNPVNRIKYIRHWEDKLKELDEAMRSVSAANLAGMRDEIDSYDEIRDNISQLTYFFKDMNTLTAEMHEGSDFSSLISALKERLGEGAGSEKAVLDSAPKQVQKTVEREDAVVETETVSADEVDAIDEYLDKVAERLIRDDYLELEDERFGELRFDMAFDRLDNYKALLMNLNEYHRFLFLYEEVLTDKERFIELEKEIYAYCVAENKKTNSYVYTFGVIVTYSVSEDIKELIFETLPVEYGFTDLGITAIAIYSADEDDIYYPKSITEKHNSDFSGKIKKYL